MSVSLNQVQAAIQNLNPGGGASGQLTLNVLHKTEALVGKLLALDTSKPLSVQILSATANGRAEVQVGALKLDVKASSPLKAGEVLQVKVEPYGATVRLVQADIPANNAVNGANGKVQGAPLNAGAVQANGGNVAGNGAVAARGVALPAAGALPPVTQSVVPAANTLGTNLQGAIPSATTPQAVAPQAAVLQGTSPQGLPSQVAGPISGAAHLTLSAPIANSAAVAGSVSGALAGVQGQVSPGGIPGSLPGALINAVTEVLPVVLPTVLKKPGDRDVLKPNMRAGADGFAGENAGGRGGAGAGNLASGAFERMNAEQALAKYSKFAGTVEEIQETHSKHSQKAADMTLELPINAGDKPVLVHLHIGPEAQGDELTEDRTPYMVRFSLETEETGPVHAALGLYRAQVRVTIWAERADFADLLLEHQELLDERMAATGLDLGSVKIRKGHPITEHFKQQAHLDAQA